MKKATVGALSALSALLLLVSMLLTGVFIAAGTPAFYRMEYRKYNQAQNLGVDDETLMDITYAIIGYLSGARDTLDMQAPIDGQMGEVFTQREKDHMVDVKALIHLARFVWIGTAALGLALLLLAGTLSAKEHRKAVSGGYLIGAAVMLAIIGVLAVCFTLDFTASFRTFHEIFFTNDLWILPRDSVLIRMVPQAFFADCALLIGGIFAFGLLVSCGIALYFLFRQDKGQGRRGGEGRHVKEPWQLKSVPGEDGEEYFRIDRKEDGKRPDAETIFTRMGLEDEEEEGEDGVPFLPPVLSSLKREEKTVAPVDLTLQQKDGVGVRFEMKLDLKLKQKSDGQVELVLREGATPNIRLTARQGELDVLVGTLGGEPQPVQAPLAEPETIPALSAQPCAPETPSLEHLLQRMDQMMQDFPEDAPASARRKAEGEAPASGEAQA